MDIIILVQNASLIALLLDMLQRTCFMMKPLWYDIEI